MVPEKRPTWIKSTENGKNEGKYETFSWFQPHTKIINYIKQNQ